MANNKTQKKRYHIGHDTTFTNLEVAEKIGSYLSLSDYISFEKDRLINDTIYPSDSSQIMKEFDWKTTKSLDDFLPETIEWYKENLDSYREFFV